MVPPAMAPAAELDAPMLSALRAQLEALVGEARATPAPRSAPLWFAAGRIAEHDLHSVRDAAAMYQEAHRADPTYVPVLRAARRLFAQLAKWPMVLALLDEERAASPHNNEELLIERARVLELRLGQADEAAAVLDGILAVSPSSPSAVAMRTQAMLQAGQAAAAVNTWVRGAHACQDNDLASSWLLTAAQVCEREPSLTGRVEALALEAAQRTPSQSGPLELLRRCHRRSGEHAKLAALLDRLADKRSEGGGEVAPLLIEHAHLLMATDARRAAALLEEARHFVPEDPLVLSDLARIYEQQQMWESLLEVLVASAQVAAATNDQLALWSEAGRVAEELLIDGDQAVALYGKCLAVDARYQPASTALGRLYAKRQQFPELLRHYELQVNAVTDPEQRAPLLFKQAELMANKLGDRDAAIAKLQVVLAESPAHAPSLQMLADLLGQANRHADLCALWEQELQDTQDAGRRVVLLEQIAALAERSLGDDERTATALKQLMSLQPGASSVHQRLSKVLTRLGAHEDLVQLHAEQAQAVSDPAAMVALYTEMGEILIDKLGRVDDAVDAFRRALQLQPGHLPALKSLGAIYGRTGRVAELIEMYRQEAEVTRRHEARASLLFTAADLAEHRLLDIVLAEQLYREVLDAASDHRPSIRALQRIATQAGQPDALIRALRLEEAVAQDPTEKSGVWVRVADVQQHQLQAHSDAVATLQRACELAPASLLAHQRLVALLSELGHTADEAAARKRAASHILDAAAQRANTLALADLYKDTLANPQEALHALRSLPAREDQDDRALWRIELELCEAQRDFDSAARVACKLAAAEPDADEGARRWLQAATWMEGSVVPPQDPLPAVLGALRAKPSHANALRWCERLYLERGAWLGLYRLYEHELRIPSTVGQRVDGRLRLGHLAEVRLGQPQQAIEHYEAALREDPGSVPAILRLKALYANSANRSEQLRLSMLDAQTTRDVVRGANTLVDIGRLQLTEHQDDSAAIDCFQRALELDPQHAGALTSLRELLLARGRVDQLAHTYARLAERATDAATASAMWREAARLWMSSQPPSTNDAMKALHGAVRIQPRDPEIWLELADVAEAAKNADAANEALLQVVGMSVAGPWVQRAHARLGLAAQVRGDNRSAIQHLTASLVLQPADRDTRRLLADCYAADGQVDNAAQLYVSLIDGETVPEQRQIMHASMAGLFERTDMRRAVGHWEQAAQLANDPAQRRHAWERVVELEERSGDVAAHVNAMVRQAESMAVMDVTLATGLLSRAAHMQLHRLQAPDAALKLARRALELSPQDVDIRGFIADLYGRLPNQMLLAIEEHRRIVRGGALRVDSLHALFRAYTQQRAPDRAYCVAELLSLLGAADENEEFYYQDNKKRVGRDSVAALNAMQVVMWLSHPAMRTATRDVLSISAPDAQSVFTDPDAELFDRKQRLGHKAEDGLRSMANGIAINLGIAPAAFDVVRSAVRRDGADVVCTDGNPVLVVGSEVARSLSTREQRFLLARALFAFSMGLHLLNGAYAKRPVVVLTAIGRAVDKTFPEWARGSDVDLLAKRVSSALSRKAKQALAEPVATLAAGAQPDQAAFQRGRQLSELRCGHVLAASLESSVRVIAKELGAPLEGDRVSIVQTHPLLLELATYHISDESFQARQQLRFAIDS
jgi:cellulose synthase operon protein C